MHSELCITDELDPEALCTRFEARLRAINKRIVRVWFYRERLDEVLAEIFHPELPCDLVYAIGQGGRQVSSNVYPFTIDISSYGQDLSARPYSITASVLHNAAFQGVFSCGCYTSQITGQPCITLMKGVTAGVTTLGFVAADFDLEQLQRS